MNTNRIYQFTILSYTTLGLEELSSCARKIREQTLSREAFQVLYLTSSSSDGTDFQKQLSENECFLAYPGANPARLLNQGISAARGEYLCFLEDGDFLGKDTLEILSAWLDRQEILPDVVKFPSVSKEALSSSEPVQKPAFTPVNLKVNYASQPSGLKGLLLRRSLFLDAPLEEALGAFAPELWLVSHIHADCSYIRTNQGIHYVDSSGQISEELQEILEQPEFFRKYILEPFAHYKHQETEVPLYMQYSLVRNIGLHVLSKDKPLHKEAILEFMTAVTDQAIWKNNALNTFQKRYFLAEKYRRLGEECPSQYLGYESLPIYLDSIQCRENFVFLEGFLVSLCYEDLEHTNFFVEANGVSFSCTPIDRRDFGQKLFGEPLSIARGFCFQIPLQASLLHTFLFKYQLPDKTLIEKTSLHYRQWCCLSDKWEASYSAQGNWLVYREKNRILIEKNSLKNRFLREYRWYQSLKNSSEESLRQAAKSRLHYHWKKLWKRKEIWLISDKTYRGDDNGEAFFLYLCRQKPKDVDFYFVLEEDSPDFQRLSKEGNVVPFLSQKHRELYLLCDYNIGAYAQKGILNPMPNIEATFQDVFSRQKRVFLQHGITHNDISASVQRYNKDFSLITCASGRESAAFLEGNYHYEPKNIVLTGFARYDRLYNDPQKIITFAPTWRRELFSGMDVHDVWTLEPGFQRSEYYRNVTGFLNHPRLLDAACKLGYTIQFIPHTVFAHHVGEFQLDPRIQVPGKDMKYREVFATSSLLLTDYSSVAFDFAYLNKPVIYFQFDRDRFFQGGHYKSGYFDYQKDGFGEVTDTLEDTVNLVIDYMKQDCEIKDFYKKRVEAFFPFQDQENCKRIYEALRSFPNA